MGTPDATCMGLVMEATYSIVSDLGTTALVVYKLVSISRVKLLDGSQACLYKLVNTSFLTSLTVIR